MNQNRVGQSPERPIYKVLAFESETKKVGKDDVMTLVDASQSDFFRPTVIETYLVGTEGMELPSDVSQYTIASESSHLDGNVDRWIHGSEGTRSTHGLDTTGMQSSGVAVAQRSTLTSQSTLRSAGWYILGLLLSIFNFFVQTQPSGSNCPRSRCVANAFDQLCYQVRLCCRSISMTCTRILQNHLATNFIAAVLDVILFVYALAFLVLSMYRT